MATAVGIDLGTTNSVIAAMEGGQAQVADEVPHDSLRVSFLHVAAVATTATCEK
jgi:molecular chaperone DnaK (HSP70)